jgi:hypothetical protein
MTQLEHIQTEKALTMTIVEQIQQDVAQSPPDKQAKISG